MNPLISVIIPIYKVERYLNECVSSVVNQTYKNLEIILVDDGSPDRCPQMCDEWAEKDSRIKVIHKENGGLSDARNAGMDIATGEYVAFVDSDDYIAESMYEKLLEGFLYSDTIGIVSCQIFSDKDGIIEVFDKQWDVLQPTILNPCDFLNSKLLEETSHCVWNKLYRHDILKNIHFLKGRNNEDTLYMYRLSKNLVENNIKELILPERFYFYRMRDDGICHSSSKPLMADIIVNLYQIQNECKQNGISLSSKVYRKYTDCLLWFFNELFSNSEWNKLYYKQMKEFVMQIPVMHIVTNYNGNLRKRYLAIRLFPTARRYWLKYLRYYL